MVIRNVIPAEIAANAVREITSFLGADLADSATWHGGAPQLDGIAPLHHAQALWDIRQHPDLYEMFAEFFGNHRLMVDYWRGMPGQLDTEPGPPAVLSEPGMKLIGVLPW